MSRLPTWTVSFISLSTASCLHTHYPTLQPSYLATQLPSYPAIYCLYLHACHLPESRYGQGLKKGPRLFVHFTTLGTLPCSLIRLSAYTVLLAGKCRLSSFGLLGSFFTSSINEEHTHFGRFSLSLCRREKRPWSPQPGTHAIGYSNDADRLIFILSHLFSLLISKDVNFTTMNDDNQDLFPFPCAYTHKSVHWWGIGVPVQGHVV